MRALADTLGGKPVGEPISDGIDVAIGDRAALKTDERTVTTLPGLVGHEPPEDAIADGVGLHVLRGFVDSETGKAGALRVTRDAAQSKDFCSRPIRPVGQNTNTRIIARPYTS